MGQYLKNQAGDMDFKWQKEYGGVVLIKGVIGEDKLFISDPKALQHVLNSGYSFRKGRARKEIARASIGRGLTYVDGDVHRRQRRVMTPAFGFPETKSYLPLYSHYANRLIEQWKREIGPNDSATVDIPTWVSKATLDVIGEAAFDYKFGAMDGGNNELKDSFAKVALKSFAAPTDGAVLIQGVFDNLPAYLAGLFPKYAPFLAFARSLYNKSIVVAKGLVQEKSEALLKGKGKRDIMSLLVKANASENEKSNLTEEEVLSQMMTMMTAGHETTASTLTWTFYELARRPDIQTRLRKDIQTGFEALRQRGESVLTTSDFEQMDYFTAFTKEVLRYYPVLPHINRTSNKDQLLPMSKPIVTKNGETIHTLPIPKDLNLLVSIAGFNRNEEVFGQDAHDFNPERWLDGTIDNCGAPLGAYSNLATFGGGVRSCIGWRFALLEYQTFLAEVVDKLEFSFAETGEKQIRKESAVVMLPTIEGEVHKGPHLPLKVSLISKACL